MTSKNSPTRTLNQPTPSNLKEGRENTQVVLNRKVVMRLILGTISSRWSPLTIQISLPKKLSQIMSVTAYSKVLILSWETKDKIWEQ